MINIHDLTRDELIALVKTLSAIDPKNEGVISGALKTIEQENEIQRSHTKEALGTLAKGVALTTKEAGKGLLRVSIKATKGSWKGLKAFAKEITEA